jgi:hypothetical protein
MAVVGGASWGRCPTVSSPLPHDMAVLVATRRLVSPPVCIPCRPPWAQMTLIVVWALCFPGGACSVVGSGVECAAVALMCCGGGKMR